MLFFFKLNIYLYDLYIRYTNFSFYSLFLYLNKYYLKNLERVNGEVQKNLPIINNLHLTANINNMRNLTIGTGSAKLFPYYISFFEEYTNYLGTENNNSFFSNINIFITLKKNYFLTSYSFNLKQLNLFNIVNKNCFYLNVFLTKNFTNFNRRTNNIFDINYNIKNNTFLNWRGFSKKYNIQLNVNNRTKKIIKNKRMFLKFFLNKNLRENKLSKYIKKIKKLSIFKKILYAENTLESVLKNFFYINNTDVDFLLKNNYVYLNGKIWTNNNYLLKINDRVQLKLNKNVFIIKRIYIQKIIKNQKDFEFYFYRFNKIKNSNITNIMDFNKKYFLILLNLLNDVPKYLEIDYSILTVFMIKKPFSIINNNIIKVYLMNFYNLHFLNWKYLY